MSDILVQIWLLLLSVLAGLIMITSALSLARRHGSQSNKSSPRHGTITILVNVHKVPNVTILKLWLKNIAQLTAKNADIVIIDSTRSSRLRSQIIQLLLKKNVKLPFYYYRPRKQASLFLMLKQGYARSKRGDAVLIVGPEHQLSNQTIKAIRIGVQADAHQPTAVHIVSEIVQTNSSVLAGFVQMYCGRLRSVYYEIRAMLRIPIHRDRIHAVALSKQTLRSMNTRKWVRINSMTNSLIATRWDSRLINASRLVWLAVAALFLYAAAYSLSLAVTRQAVQPFLLLWLLVVVVLFLVIITSRSLTSRQKLLYTYSLPAGLYVVAAGLIIQICDVLRQLGRIGIAYFLRFM